MASFMREHADDLARVIRLYQQSGEEEYPLATGHKGIERWVIDDMDGHGIRGKTSRSKDRRSEFADHSFRFGVADEAQVLGERRPDDRGNENRENE